MKKKLLLFVSLFGLLCIPLPTIAEEQVCNTPETSEAKIDLSFVELYPEGISSRKAIFTAGSDGHKVIFCKGNLRYKADNLLSHLCADGVTREGSFEFAETQYTIIGKENGYRVNGATIDLFAFGTSGYGNTQITGVTGGAATSSSITGNNKYYDWGELNPITNGGNKPGIWRTPTKDEWTYIFYTRPSAADKLGAGRVNTNNSHSAYSSSCSYVYGWILLPDEWECPAGLEFKKGDDNSISFTNNVYTEAEWQRMAEAGAIFLPISGYSNGSSVSGPVEQVGYVWSSTCSSGEAYCVCNRYNTTSTSSTSSTNNGYGYQVRLVHDY